MVFRSDSKTVLAGDIGGTKTNLGLFQNLWPDHRGVWLFHAAGRIVPEIRRGRKRLTFEQGAVAVFVFAKV